MTPASVGLVAPRAAAAASRGRWWLLMGVAALLLVLDQSAKWVVAANLPLGQGITVTAWFNLVHVLNPGASFSFLADAGGWQRHALTAVGIAVSVALAVLLWRGVRSRLEKAAYVGLIGGALGNVVDRLLHGYVVDFLQFRFGFLAPIFHGGYFPSFNLADSAITLGAFCLILDEILRVRRAG